VSHGNVGFTAVTSFVVLITSGSEITIVSSSRFPSGATRGRFGVWDSRSR